MYTALETTLGEMAFKHNRRCCRLILCGALALRRAINSFVLRSHTSHEARDLVLLSAQYLQHLYLPTMQNGTTKKDKNGVRPFSIFVFFVRFCLDYVGTWPAFHVTFPPFRKVTAPPFSSLTKKGGPPRIPLVCTSGAALLCAFHLAYIMTEVKN